MHNKLSVCAIIPARGGSKSIPRKNIVRLMGKPLLAYSIEHAMQAGSVNRVIVSTDDEEIARVAEAHGADLPFVRPAELAGDDVLDWPVFKHALDWLRTHESYEPEIVVHLRPTAPLRRAEQIDECVSLLSLRAEADSVRSVSFPSQHPYRMFELDKDGFLVPLLQTEQDRLYLLRRQDWPDVYWYNGVIDVTRSSTILRLNSMVGNRILPYVMDARYVVDIDSPEDLVVAEVKLRAFLESCESA